MPMPAMKMRSMWRTSAASTYRCSTEPSTFPEQNLGSPADAQLDELSRGQVIESTLPQLLDQFRCNALQPEVLELLHRQIRIARTGVFLDPRSRDVRDTEVLQLRR